VTASLASGVGTAPLLDNPSRNQEAQHQDAIRIANPTSQECAQGQEQKRHQQDQYEIRSLLERGAAREILFAAFRVHVYQITPCAVIGMCLEAEIGSGVQTGRARVPRRGYRPPTPRLRLRSLGTCCRFPQYSLRDNDTAAQIGSNAEHHHVITAMLTHACQSKLERYASDSSTSRGT